MQAVLDLPQTEPRNEIDKPVFAREETIEKVLLRGISWETYESLSRDLIDKSNIRMSYDAGKLEMSFMESAGHAKLAELLNLIVISLSEALEIDFFPTGSTTFRKEKGEKGFEADGSFYFRNAEVISAKDNIDLTVDPPPELIVEVDVTNSSLPRFPIFAGLSVLEVWRYDGESVKFHRLQDDETYLEIDESVCLPTIKSEEVTKLLKLGFEIKLRVWLKMIRESI